MLERDKSWMLVFYVGLLAGLLAGIITVYACISIGLEDERLEGHTWGE